MSSKKSGATSKQGAYFLSLSVQNIRCFGDDEQTLDLSDGCGRPARWTLLLGNNGTGKTTLLQLLAATEHAADEWGDLPEEVSVWPKEFVMSLRRGQPDTRTTAECVIRTVSQEGLNDRAAQTGKAKVVSRKCRQTASEAASSHPFEPDPICFAYGATRKLQSGHIAGTADPGRCESLFEPSSGLRNAEEWLLQLDYSATKATRRSQLATKLTRRRDQVLRILEQLLPDVESIRITLPSSEEPNPQVQFRTPFGWVPLDGIAFGYQTLIAWIVDLASRLVDLYPDSEDPLSEPAVVLVDEIDLHLHPSWQRNLMQYLTERFPNTQFIATAHSPLVVQAAPMVEANVVLLRRERDHIIIDNDVESVRGWRVDQILSSELYGTSARDPVTQELIDERRRLLGKPKLTKRDTKRVEEIEEEIGQLPIGESPEQIRTSQLLQKSLDLLQNVQTSASET